MSSLQDNFAIYNCVNLTIIAEVRGGKVEIINPSTKRLLSFGMAVPADLKDNYRIDGLIRRFIYRGEADFDKAFLEFYYPRHLKRQGYRQIELEKVGEIKAKKLQRIEEIRKRKLESDSNQDKGSQSVQERDGIFLAP